MNCPHCKTPMIILEYDEVEVDFCIDCAGIWLDSGELELLFGERTITEGFLNAGERETATTEKPIKCPCCSRRMEKRVTGGDAQVIYDRCPNGNGLWFDHGELTTVLEHGSTAPGGESITSWLRELFPGGSQDASTSK